MAGPGFVLSCNRWPVIFCGSRRRPGPERVNDCLIVFSLASARVPCIVRAVSWRPEAGRFPRSPGTTQGCKLFTLLVNPLRPCNEFYNTMYQKIVSFVSGPFWASWGYFRFLICFSLLKNCQYLLKLCPIFCTRCAYNVHKKYMKNSLICVDFMRTLCII